MTTSPTRLTKAARREQLLDAALGIVRAQGADALTLVTLAEAAGVSRPIAYDHFGTRPGLLLALYRRLDERHRQALDEALKAAPANAEAIARVLSTAYFACATDVPEFTAVSAALKGDPEVASLQQEMLDAYAEVMGTALAPYSGLAPEALRLRCLGILGAAEAIATELNRGRTTPEQAVGALADLITAGAGSGPGCP
ncbi:TetR/AcrR family transcriptional regulator [Yinghuangia soli]|uniref:TetR/AcrR family transcriptional regulator n=1 Tax=Yinghuangia soli TaxID=2908204 RepID=A0AA41PVJ5_9ACTN|nr:TetR/AcrR family transcriptional regulator [Yinghuangia soli]MCF2526518.1 TetR/AcrR family transcriptional regulator [Yinghuangia soli]